MIFQALGLEKNTKNVKQFGKFGHFGQHLKNSYLTTSNIVTITTRNSFILTCYCWVGGVSLQFNKRVRLIMLIVEERLRKMARRNSENYRWSLLNSNSQANATYMTVSSAAVQLPCNSTLFNTIVLFRNFNSIIT